MELVLLTNGKHMQQTNRTPCQIQRQHGTRGRLTPSERSMSYR